MIIKPLIHLTSAIFLSSVFLPNAYSDENSPVSEDPTNATEADWIFCTGEFANCTVPVPSIVRYGLDGVYFYKEMDGLFTCNNATFGNPVGARKKCDYFLSDQTDHDNDGVADNIDVFPANPNESADTDADGFGNNSDPFPLDATNGADKDWVFCNDEYFTCTLPAPALLRYGINGVYFYHQVEGTVTCNNATFGSPIGLRKKCDYLLSELADYDNDGVVDSVDAFPSNPNESADTDEDGFGNNNDPFPLDATNGADKDWVFCSGEYSICTVPAPSLLRYGINGVYFYHQVEGSVTCNNATFGSPTSLLKECDYLLSDQIDYDNDGVVDNADAFPSNSDESADTDADGFGDNSDPFPLDATNGADKDWVFCNDEYFTCTLPAPSLLRYGINGVYFYHQVEGTVTCNNATFGSPIGLRKKCDYLLSDLTDYDNDGFVDSNDPFPADATNGAEANWVFCSEEFVHCTVPVPSLVRYGLNGVYFYKQMEGLFTCNNATFGNPIGVRKACHYLLSDQSDHDNDGVVDSADVFPANPTESVDSDADGLGDNSDPFPIDPSNAADANWIFCSGEYSTCTPPVPSLVRYGINGVYFYQQISGTVTCNNATFGSPIGLRKECDYLLSDITDYDNDGVVDSQDVFPTDPTESADTDGDGYGDNIDPSDNPHTPGSSKHAEHSAALDLVKHEDATHTAINNGSWFDATTWATGVVPTSGARVLIPSGVAVTYDAVSDTRLFTLRVDGELHFSTDLSSKMIVDTMFVDVVGELTIGTVEQPVKSHVNVEIVIADNGNIDVAWDPSLLSRSLLLHGWTQMHGQEKTVHLKALNDPMAGDTSMTLASAPSNWNVGDTLVIAGTRYDNYKWDGYKVAHFLPEDDVVTIAEIDGNTVTFTTPLLFNHDTPRAYLKTSVGNYTRNITIRSENGAASQRHHRGHVMFMHNDNVDVRYVAFNDLGRTDKSVPAHNPFEFGQDIAADSNVKGRYPMHFHRTGLDDVENPTIARGNAVSRSPGWGYVHHDSNAVIHNNVSHDTFGAAFIAETGNEIGSWSNNLAIYTKGINSGTPKTGGDRHFALDNGKTGSAFYFEGRMVEAIDNIAASTTTGFSYFHRGRRYDPTKPLLDGTISFDASLFDYPEAVGLSTGVHVDDAPILHFTGNEAFAITMGVFVEKANTDQGHDVRTRFIDFTAWEVMWGAHIAYSSHYVLDNFEVIGKVSTQFSHAYVGIDLGTNVSDMTVLNPKVDGFKYGINVEHAFGLSVKVDAHLKQIDIVNPVITNTEIDYKDINESFNVLSSEDIIPGRFQITLDRSQLSYKHTYPTPADPDGRFVYVQGTKLDSVGEVPFPAGRDHNYANLPEVVTVLEQSGYYSNNGKNYFILEDYYSDRATGEVHKYGELVELNDDVPLGRPFLSFENAVYKGEIDINSAAPIAGNDSASTTLETDVTINLLANDTDPAGDTIIVDGIVQPLNGRVFDNKDGTVTYRPDFDFTGTDSFKYWVTDNFGNFTPATATVQVSP